MINIRREGIILGKTERSFENEGVMNPAVITRDNTVHMFYRAVKKGNYSTIGYCRLEGPLQIVRRNELPLVSPQFNYERQGVEDPRIVRIGSVYYMSYTAYDGKNAFGALAISDDLVHFQKQGIITPVFSYAEFAELVASQEHLTDKYFRTYNKRETENETGEKIVPDR